MKIIKKQEQVMFVQKNAEGQDGLSTEEVQAVFEQSDDLQLIKEAVERSQERLYVTWATVDAVDNEGERVPIDEAINQQEVLLRRGAPIQNNHTNQHVGRTLAYKVLQHPQTQTLGILHLNLIFADNDVDDLVWKETQSGERKGSSVGGYNKQAVPSFDPATGQFMMDLKGYHQYETSNVNAPCNPWATNVGVSLLAKSNHGRCERFANPCPVTYGMPVKKEAGEVNVINNPSTNPIKSNPTQPVSSSSSTDKIDKGESTMTELSIEEITKKVAKGESLSTEESQFLLSKANSKKEMEEDKDKVPAKNEEEEEEVKKDMQASPVDGEKENEKQPESPNPQDNNEMDAVSKALEPVLKQMQSMEARMQELSKASNEQVANVQKMQTVNTARPDARMAEVKKHLQTFEPYKIALGERKPDWHMVNKAVRGQKRYANPLMN